jgi:hypothetical protein
LHRWTCPNHPLRQGDDEKAPAPRRHMNVCRQGQDNEDWDGQEVAKPYHATGVTHFCPLASLHLFDIVWDIACDYMHTVKGFWEARIIKTFNGERHPRPYTKSEPKQDEENYRTKLKEWRSRRTANAKLKTAHTLCTFSAADKRKVDERVKNLCGEPDWINQTLVRNHTYAITKTVRYGEVW